MTVQELILSLELLDGESKVFGETDSGYYEIGDTYIDVLDDDEKPSVILIS